MSRILVACEFTGTVRRAFAARGHDAWSCDLLPAEDGSNRHLVCDVRDILNDGWDMLIVAHPPCTRLCNSGVRWLKVPPPGRSLDEMWAELEAGAALFSDCWNAPVPRVCIENPIMHGHARTRIRAYEKPAQIVQPWWFGEPQFKATGLYLRGLPKLVETDRLVPPARGSDEHKVWSRVHRMSRSKDRGRERSRFFPGIAAAMADQWGPLLEAVAMEVAE
ncbi:MAG: DNA cytosine methyltransferase [Opitutaceae bacterium]|nr:DNA cytosine methyltransferase [Opitutaceae bacterium]